MTEPVLNQITKFSLDDVERQTFMIPGRYRIMSIGLDREDLRDASVAMWVAIDRNSPQRAVEIFMLPDTCGLPHVGDFIGTVRVGNFVWHFFTGPGDSANMSSGFHYETRGNGNG